MIDKFQKLFGPNPPRKATEAPEVLSFANDPEYEEHRKALARIRTKRRLLGLMAMLMAVAIAAPTIFEPNDYYADRGAKIEIPALADGRPAKVVSLIDTDNKAAAERPVPGVVPDKPSAAESLSQTNKVSAGAKPAIGTVEVVDKAAKASASEDGVSKTVNLPSKSTVAGRDKKEEAKKKEPPKATVASGAQAVEQPLAGIGPLRASANGRYFIQVIATSNKAAAQKRATALRELGLPAYTEIVHRRGSDLWRVRVGRFMTQDEARRALDILALNSIENGGINQEPKKQAK